MFSSPRFKIISIYIEFTACIFRLTHPVYIIIADRCSIKNNNNIPRIPMRIG